MLWIECDEKKLTILLLLDLSAAFDTVDQEKLLWILKYVSKYVTLIARFWNIFANSHLMDVISIVVDSKHYVDNFQPVFVAKTAKFHMKKKGGKFDDFWKTNFWLSWLV